MCCCDTPNPGSTFSHCCMAQMKERLVLPQMRQPRHRSWSKYYSIKTAIFSLMQISWLYASRAATSQALPTSQALHIICRSRPSMSDLVISKSYALSWPFSGSGSRTALLFTDCHRFTNICVGTILHIHITHHITHIYASILHTVRT